MQWCQQNAGPEGDDIMFILSSGVNWTLVSTLKCMIPSVHTDGRITEDKHQRKEHKDYRIKEENFTTVVAIKNGTIMLL